MNRSDAERIAAPFVQQINQYQAIPYDSVKQLLGEETFATLLADKVRGCGPTRDTIYPWNVIDYLQLKN